MRAIHRFVMLFATLSLILGAGGCRKGDLSISSVKKLPGAPARIRGLVFSQDGKTLYTVETREPDEKDAAAAAGKPEGTKYVIMARDATGKGTLNEVVRSEGSVLSYTSFGAGLAFVREDSAPPTFKPTDDTLDALLESFRKERAAREAIAQRDALYYAGPDGKVKRISQEGVRCYGVTGSADGKVIAYWTAVSKEPWYKAQIHVLDQLDGPDTTLDVLGVVVGVSPDGSRLLVNARSEEETSPLSPKRREAPPLKSDLMVITRKDKSVVHLPSKVQLGGDEVVPGERHVVITDTGLVIATLKGVWRTDFNGSNPVNVLMLPELPPAPAGSSKPAASEDPLFDEARPRTYIGPRGTVWAFSKVGDRVEVKAYPNKKDAPTVTLASLEGPITSYGTVRPDGAESKLAFGILNDTTRDGTLSFFDNAEVFVTSSDKGSLSFDRQAITPLSAELVPKLASAAGVDASKVIFKAKDGGETRVEIKLDLPADATSESFVEKVLSAARAAMPLLPKKMEPKVKITLGPASFDVTPRKDVVSGLEWFYIDGAGLLINDPNAPLLRLHKPKQVTLHGFGDDNVTQTGELENPGRTPTPPITAFMVVKSGYGDLQKQREVTKELGVIEPGKRASYELKSSKSYIEQIDGPSFRTAAGRVSIFNTYARDHSMNFLDVALALYREHGVWASHPELLSSSGTRVSVTDAQMSLPTNERAALFKKIFDRIAKHEDKFHNRSRGLVFVEMVGPSGSGYKVTSDDISILEPKKTP